jgi:hypothetical protein
VTSASLAFVLRAVSLMPVQQSHPNGVAWRGSIASKRSQQHRTELPSFACTMVDGWMVFSEALVIRMGIWLVPRVGINIPCRRPAMDNMIRQNVVIKSSLSQRKRWIRRHGVAGGNIGSGQEYVIDCAHATANQGPSRSVVGWPPPTLTALDRS